MLGAVFLVMTGGEALYADMGHFGKLPIRLAWFTLVLPGNFAQLPGTRRVAVEQPGCDRQPFYLLAPSWALYPLVALATIATVIASQAVISGVFHDPAGGATRFLSAHRIRHTSASEIGQIYLPGANWGLLIGVLVLVLGFESSSNLAAAYGIAVTITMVITTLLVLVLARRAWGWNGFKLGLGIVFFSWWI